jgi:lipopolysaccharide assembly outer membrane protein LptD (OstA)
MNYKIVSQLVLFILIVVLIAYFYKNYLNEKNKNLSLINEPINNSNIENVENNLVKDITYKKIYNSTGDEFIIKASYGEFIDENNEVIIISNVNAFINRKNGTIVYITSDNAKYDTINNNTSFMDNVKLIYLEHKITSDFIDIIFSKNLVQAYGNLMYQNQEYTLIADKMNLDLITKNTKIFMIDNSKVRLKKN